MKVEILTIGNELLSGVIVDTNGAWLSARLYARGVLVERNVTVLDELDAVAGALTAARDRGVDLVVACGGLGPTEDDLTAEAAAKAAGVAFEEHPEARALIEDRFARMGRTPTPRQFRQAQLPAGCRVIPNAHGTAPAFSVQLGKTTAFFLPGPPREFRPLVEAEILPFVDARTPDRHFASATVRTFGRFESDLADDVNASGVDLTGVELGYRLFFPEIHLRLRAGGATAEAARSRCEAAAAGLEAALGDYAFGREDDDFAALVGRRLVDAGKTVALAESCTGGLAGKLLTDVAGSSRYLLLSAVTYANEMKTKLLGVPEALLATDGAVSEACARAMAEGALKLSGADLAVSITGIAGPDGGTPDKPVGTVHFALAERGRPTVAKLRRAPGDRAQIRLASAYFALDLLRRRLEGRLEP